VAPLVVQRHDKVSDDLLECFEVKRSARFNSLLWCWVHLHIHFVYFYVNISFSIWVWHNWADSFDSVRYLSRKFWMSFCSQFWSSVSDESKCVIFSSSVDVVHDGHDSPDLSSQNDVYNQSRNQSYQSKSGHKYGCCEFHIMILINEQGSIDLSLCFVLLIFWVCYDSYNFM